MKTSKPCDNAFDRWLAEVDHRWLAKELKINTATIRFWRLKYCYPRVKHMQQIKRITCGRISYAMIIDRKLVTKKVG